MTSELPICSRNFCGFWVAINVRTRFSAEREDNRGSIENGRFEGSIRDNSGEIGHRTIRQDGCKTKGFATFESMARRDNYRVSHERDPEIGQMNSIEKAGCFN